jgi:hypothetical protein
MVALLSREFRDRYEQLSTTTSNHISIVIYAVPQDVIGKLLCQAVIENDYASRFVFGVLWSNLLPTRACPEATLPRQATDTRVT